MKNALSLLFILLLTILPAQAFRLFHRPNKAPQQIGLNEEILIEGKFGNPTTSKLNPIMALDLRLAIHIPRDQEYLTITTLYDEINENPIEQITWVVDQGKKQKPIKIKAVKIDQVINQKIESIALEYNPTLAYDRINDNKHIINKTFYYQQAAIFGDISKKPNLSLELYIPGSQGLKTKSIRIDEQIYTSIPKAVEPKLTPTETINNRPRVNPNAAARNAIPQTAPQGMEIDPDLEYARQQLNDFNSNSQSANNQGTNNQNSSYPNPNEQQLQQLQQLQQQMQIDSIDDEYGDFGEDEMEEDEEDSDF